MIAAIHQLGDSLTSTHADLAEETLEILPPVLPRVSLRIVSAAGQRLGRYETLAPLGAGAMGVVVAAYDPRLDRKVALKLSRVEQSARGVARSRRLSQEAQALARLDHRNVVSVYDVGVHEGQPYMAMELVEGRTLGQWMEAGDGPQPWREVLAVFMEAGRGLAAAHEAGLVHRDFKPDNVMIGDDGRVRVMDFGLARAVHTEGDQGQDQGAKGCVAPGTLASLARLTQTGTMMGTPAYMSLEQFEGAEVDARSDQFSFCVALYKALYGERPFAGATLTDLLRAIQSGAVREGPSGTRVPRWLRRVIVRGLAKDPARRWPSMEALLEALAADPTPRLRRWWTTALATMLTTAAVVVGLVGAVTAWRGDAQCEDTEVGAELEAAGGLCSPSRRGCSNS